MPYEFYVLDADGARFPQSSAPDLVARVLRLLDARPGEHVLEIGTGSGYSAAVLSRLVGHSGRVVSVDHAEEVVPRARALLRRDGRDNVTVVLADGLQGWATGAHDRLVAWASVSELSDSWLEQMAQEE